MIDLTQAAVVVGKALKGLFPDGWVITDFQIQMDYLFIQALTNHDVPLDYEFKGFKILSSGKDEVTGVTDFVLVGRMGLNGIMYGQWSGYAPE